jgi:hypothetical protein
MVHWRALQRRRARGATDYPRFLPAAVSPEGKIIVGSLKGPLEEGGQDRVAAFAARLPAQAGPRV